jgi:hypothetical protein
LSFFRGSDKIDKGSNSSWRDPSVGILTAFDQSPYIESAIADFAKIGGDPYVDTKLKKYGYVYYPSHCVSKEMITSDCSLIILSHDFDQKAYDLI